MRSLRLALLVAATAATAGAPDASASPGPSADLAAELARLAGHRVAVSPDGASYRILDVAGEGAPEVGVVERRGRTLLLRRADGTALELTGPLAVPRIAGPGYKIWVLGRLERGALVARRIGVLARPLASRPTIDSRIPPP